MGKIGDGASTIYQKVEDNGSMNSDEDAQIHKEINDESHDETAVIRNRLQTVKAD